MPATVEVRFKGTRKDYFLWPAEDAPLRLQEPVIVESDRGLDFGRISATDDVATAKCAVACSGCATGEAPTPTFRVLRRASQEEIATANELRRSEEETRQQVIERIRAHKLEMKAADTEWQWDRKKLTVYFTAEQRVDFRELVRDLAARLKTRIELRQIGVRDEAARLGGVGRCGREYCCSTWLTELSPVSLALAKDQHLSLNPAQISGGCGRLLCCLKYEHEFYVKARKRFPKEGKSVRTLRGTEKVIAVDIFRERVFLRHDEEGPRIVALLDLNQEMETAASGPLPEAAAPAPSRPAASPRPERPARAERPPRPDRQPRRERTPVPEVGAQAPPPPAEPPPTPAPPAPAAPRRAPPPPLAALIRVRALAFGGGHSGGRRRLGWRRWRLRHDLRDRRAFPARLAVGTGRPFRAR
ncbi:MAG: stage 0 sporulation family protein [Gemmatimonadales bacterium]